jgi:hypothetical protein
MNETDTEMVETLLTDGGETSPKQLARDLPILDLGHPSWSAISIGQLREH